VLIGLALLAPRARPARAEEDPAELLRALRTALVAATSITADLEVVEHLEREVFTRRGTLRLLKPNYARIQLDHEVTASDGRHLWELNLNQLTYRRSQPGPLGELIQVPAAPLAGYFFPGRVYTLAARPGDQVRFGGRQRVGEVECRILAITGDRIGVMRIFIGPDNLPRRMEITNADGSFPRETTLRNLRVDEKLAAADFAFQLPAGAELEGPQDAKLLPEGSPAPDFDLPQPGGGRLRLADLRKGSKAVLVNFWFYG
jgi:outer membrane lipoprotein-sorting protein